MVNYFLCDRRFIIQSVFYDHCFTVYNWKHRMIHIGASSLRVNGITFMLFGYYTVYSSLFLALGKGKEGFILGACRQGICFIPVILIFPFIWGIKRYFICTADCRCSLCTYYSIYGNPFAQKFSCCRTENEDNSFYPCDRQ